MIEQKAKEYALSSHNGQKYGDREYTFHLEAVVALAKKFNLSKEVIAGCWLHDTIEDCGVSFDEIKEEFGQVIANIVYCVSDEPGLNRKEQKLKTYPKIASNESALCVKLCDRIANLKQSILDKKMELVFMYLEEHKEFRKNLYNQSHSGHTLALWDYLENIIAEGNEWKHNL